MMYVFPWCISICKLPTLGVWSMIDFLLELGFAYIYLSEREALEW
jgi:NADH:ubiquinone oxidoreductase subunit 3 (subunit A)